MARRLTILLLGLAMLASSSAPTIFARSLFPCMDPSDCPAMAELCDMQAMTSHDSCCQPGRMSADSTMPATVQRAVQNPAVPGGDCGSIAVDLPTDSRGFSFTPATLAASPPGSPPFTAILRI